MNSFPPEVFVHVWQTSSSLAHASRRMIRRGYGQMSLCRCRVTAIVYRWSGIDMKVMSPATIPLPEKNKRPGRLRKAA